VRSIRPHTLHQPLSIGKEMAAVGVQGVGSQPPRTYSQAGAAWLFPDLEFHCSGSVNGLGNTAATELVKAPDN
jgi:hypothetical protein